MDVNQFALYQLKNIPENRQIRFRPYSTLQEKGIQIQYKDYTQVYLARMQPGDEPEQIRRRFNEKLPRTFHGHSISVSDVLVLNKGGVVTSYYVEKDGFTVITGFIQKGSSGALVSIDTADFHIEGKEGSWHAFDSIIIDGRQFFLMEHETYGKEVAWVVLDEEGKIIVDHTYQGFDQAALQQIKDYLNPPQLTAGPQKQEIPDGNIQTQSGKAAPQTGGDRKAVWEACAADGGGRGYGVQTEVRNGEVSGERCQTLLFFCVLNNREFLCIIKP